MQKSTLKLKTTTNTITGAEYLLELLSENGTDTIFGYPGSPILSIYEALSKTNKIKPYLVRHEQSAIHSAEGYAKTKKTCGVVLVTSGPGFSNVMTGLANAYLDKTPIVVISGQTENKDQNEFQDIDIAEMSKPCTKSCYEINSIDELEKVIKSAFYDALKIPQGPVVVTVKNSVLNSHIEPTNNYKIKQNIKVDAPHSYVKDALKSLSNSKSPLIIVGGGAKNAKQEVLEFAKLSHIPVVNTLMGTGCVDEISNGMIGINGDEVLNKKIENSDVVLAIGVRFTNRTTSSKPQFLKNSKIYNINIEPCSSQNIKIERNLIGEADVVLQHLIGTIKTHNILFNINYRWIESFSNEDIIQETDKLTVESAISTIYENTKRYYPTVTTDVGLHQVACAKIFKTTDSSHFITSGGFGAMGFGLPSAIGSQIANPNSLVINITGDGSFQMNMQELGTIAEYNLPIKIFIINNSSLGMIAETQKQNGFEVYQSNMLNPNFVKIANAYGIQGYKVTSKKELEQALKEMFICKKPLLVDIIV